MEKESQRERNTERLGHTGTHRGCVLRAQTWAAGERTLSVKNRPGLALPDSTRPQCSVGSPASFICLAPQGHGPECLALSAPPWQGLVAGVQLPSLLTPSLHLDTTLRIPFCTGPKP